MGDAEFLKMVARLADPQVSANLIAEVDAADKAKAEAATQVAEWHKVRSQVQSDQRDLSAGNKLLEQDRAAFAKERAAHAAAAEVYQKQSSEFALQRADFDRRMADLVIREGALTQRGAWLKAREDKVAAGEADVAKRWAALKQAMG